MPPIRQSNFSAGEFAEGLWARTDLKRFGSAVRKARNFIPRQDGPLTTRAGLLDKGAAHDTNTANPARSWPFIFSVGTIAKAFVLEIGVGYISVWKDGAIVATVATDYTAAEVPRLKFTQAGQVLTICCKQKVQRELTWVSDANWTLADYSIIRSISAPTGLAVVTAPAGDATVLAKVHQWVVTAINTDEEESLPSAFVEATCALAQNKPGKISWNAVGGAVEYNVFRGRNRKFGFVGSTPLTSFEDDGNYPVYAEAPPGGRNPFPSADYYPQVVGYHDQRLVFANAWNNPAGVEMSMGASFKNFDRAKPPKATDAVTFAILGQRYEEIRALVSHGHSLIVFTNATELPVTGSEGVVMQDDIAFGEPTHWGSSWLDPLLIGDVILFEQDVGGSVREYMPASPREGNDLSLLARHLFEGHKIVSWAYQHEPFRVVWAVRDDGVLLSCTYVKQHDTWAWARHDTGNGDLFESVCVIPEGTETAAYFLVKRYVNGAWTRRMERMAQRVGLARADSVCLDAAKVYSGAAITTMTGLTHLVGRTVYVLADGVPRGPFVVNGSGQAGPFPAATKVVAGLKVNYESVSLDLYSQEQEVRTISKSVSKVWLEVTQSASFRAGQQLTDDLQQWTAPDGGLYDGLAEVLVDTEWDPSGAVVIVQDEPLPLTILSLIREVEW